MMAGCRLKAVGCRTHDEATRAAGIGENRVASGWWLVAGEYESHENSVRHGMPDLPTRGVVASGQWLVASKNENNEDSVRHGVPDLPISHQPLLVARGQWLVASEERDARTLDGALVPGQRIALTSSSTSHQPLATNHYSSSTSHQPLATSHSPSPSTSHQLLATSHCRRLRRRGITLTEVLISMFVLMIGLLGVAAMIPAGRHEILEGTKIDNATAVGRAAFRDLKIRGYLNPANWDNGSGVANTLYNPLTRQFAVTSMTKNDIFNVTPAAVIDPLGLTTPAIAPALPPGNSFPTANSVPPLAPAYPIPRLHRIYPNYQIAASASPLMASDLVFRASDDLLFTASTTGQDNPPEQTVYYSTGTGAAMRPYSTAGTPLKRASEGNYSWLATLVTDPSTSALYSNLTVSVAVFYKRDLSNSVQTERVGSIIPNTGTAYSGTVNGFPGWGIGGGEIQFTHPAVVPPAKQIQPLKPGQWVMLAGTMQDTNPNPIPPPTYFTYTYYRWYRVVAADVLQGNTQFVNLAGQDWNPVMPTQIWIFDNVVTVYEKSMRLEVE